jgi:hypothetical protein
MKNYISSVLLFLIIQNILVTIETIPYMNMVSGLQGERADIWTTPFLKIKSFFSYVLGFAAVLYLYIVYIVDKASVLEAAIFGFMLYFIADINIFVFFKRSINHIPALLWDSFLIGFIGFGLAIFIERNYSAYLTNSLPFFILFILSFIPPHITFTNYALKG